jgi:hypothetical protein
MLPIAMTTANWFWTNAYGFFYYYWGSHGGIA